MTPTETWLARLIAFPTVSADSNLALIGMVEQALQTLGAALWRFPDATGQKTALLARLGPDVAGGLMLSAHVDTVPVTGQSWTHPPFDLTAKGGRLYGRGTTDMKGFVAAMLTAATRHAGARLTKPLWLALSYDEEVGCIGVRPMLAAITARNIRPDLVLAGEPTMLGLGLGHKGKIALTATAQGTNRHSAEAPLACNALHLAADFTQGLRALQDRLAQSGAREDGYSVPYATVHLGRLTGGTVVNLVPDRAEMLLEIRHGAGDDADALLAEVQTIATRVTAPYRLVFPTADLQVTETNRYPALSSAATTPAIAAFAALLPDATPRNLSFGTEGGLFADALKAPVIICGPGDMAQGHTADEYIEAAQLAACDALLDRAIPRFCQTT